VASKSPSSPVVPRSQAEPRGSATILHEADGLLAARWKNVGLHVWTVKATPAHVAVLDALSKPFVTAYPDGISSIHVIAKDVGLPDGDTREALRVLTQKWEAHISCVCHVVEGSGFWFSALQSFLTGLHLLGRAKYQLHIGSTIADCAQWLPKHHAEKTKVVLDAAELERELLALRKRAG
jgi:hypothetical protein